MRQRLAQAHIELTIMRYNTLRSLSGVDGPVAPPEASIAKLYWGSWHQGLGDIAMAALGPAATVLDGDQLPENHGYGLNDFQRSFLFSPLRDHLRRVERDPAQHHRGTCPRPTRGTERGSVSTSLDTPFDPPPPPTPPTGHGLLADKVVIVTAAAGTGIGSATARRCLEEGAAVIISDAHERRLAETAEQLAAKDGPAGADGERVHAIACNVTDEVQFRTLYAGAVEHFGRIDVAVHNAGLGGTVPLVDMTDEQWSTVLDITLTGTFRCTRAAMTHLLPQRRGVIVNNASVLGWRAQPGQAHYAAAKAVSWP